MKEKLFKKGKTKRLFSVVLALAVIMTLMPSMTVKAEPSSPTWTKYEGHDQIFWYDEDSCDVRIEEEGDVSVACKVNGCWAGSFLGTYYRDGTFNWDATATCPHIVTTEPTSEPDPSTCSHEFSEWKYAPSYGDEWRYCSKCHKEERRAVASSSSSSSSKPAEPTKTDIEVREAVEETLPVSPVSVDATQFNKADAAIIPGGTYNLSNFITTKGIVKGINTVVAASNKSGSNAVTIYSGRPFAFNGEILKAIQAGKKDVTYFFNHDGHLYSVTIPATVDATKVLEKTGFAGPLYVGQQLGTTKLVK